MVADKKTPILSYAGVNFLRFYGLSYFGWFYEYIKEKSLAQNTGVGEAYMRSVIHKAKMAKKTQVCKEGPRLKNGIIL